MSNTPEGASHVWNPWSISSQERAQWAQTHWAWTGPWLLRPPTRETVVQSLSRWAGHVVSGRAQSVNSEGVPLNCKPPPPMQRGAASLCWRMWGSTWGGRWPAGEGQQGLGELQHSACKVATGKASHGHSGCRPRRGVPKESLASPVVSGAPGASLGCDVEGAPGVLYCHGKDRAVSVRCSGRLPVPCARSWHVEGWGPCSVGELPAGLGRVLGGHDLRWMGMWGDRREWCLVACMCVCMCVCAHMPLPAW